jgi:hypothetical protein
MKKDSLKTQISTLLNGKKEHFIKFYIKDQFYKQIQSDRLKPGVFLHGETLTAFGAMNIEDTVCVQDDQTTCDEMIKFLLDPSR